MKRVALVLLLVNVAAIAGESRKGDSGEEKYELLPMGRRDPFTIWKPQVVAPPPVNPVASPLNIEVELKPRAQVTRTPSRIPSEKPTKDPEIPLAKARSSLDSAYHFLFIGEHSAAIASSEDAMRHLEELTLDRAGRLQEEAMRISKAAKRPMKSPRWIRVPKNLGNQAESTNMAVPGNPRPAGSLQGPK